MADVKMRRSFDHLLTGYSNFTDASVFYITVIFAEIQFVLITWKKFYPSNVKIFRECSEKATIEKFFIKKSIDETIDPYSTTHRIFIVHPWTCDSFVSVW